MKNATWISLSLVLLCSLAAYLATGNLYLALGVLLLFLFAALFLFLPAIKTHGRKERIRHECYQFINSYVITLSVCHSLDHAYEVASGDIKGEFALLQSKIAHMNSLEKTMYLVSYFEMEIYAMFTSVISIYLDRGGDVLHLSSELLNELARIEDNGRYVAIKAKRALLSFTLLWAMATVVIVFIRFGLSNFFSSIKDSTNYLLGVGAFFLFLLVSSYLYLRVYVGGGAKRIKERKGKHAKVR